MKKISTLLMMLCMFVGTSWAQLVQTSTAESPKYYLLGSYNRGGFLTNAGEGQGLKHIDAIDGSYWYFEKANDEGGVYIVNKLKGKNDAKIYVDKEKKASSTAAVWYLLDTGVNKNGVAISSTPSITFWNCIDANNSNDGVGGWHPSTGDWQGTTWSILDVTAVTDAVFNPENYVGRDRKSNCDRRITSISVVGSMGTTTVVLNNDYLGQGYAYNNYTANTIKVVAGEQLNASVAINAGGWINAYAYIDADGTPGFSASIADDGFSPAGDLVSYSFYNGKNSEGTELTDGARNTRVLPAFTAPSTEGTYRLRFKLDWDNITPNGGHEKFTEDGGSFVDVTLQVVSASNTCDVKYSFTYGGVEKFTQNTTGEVGEEFPEITVEFPYGITATKPEGVIAAGEVVDGVVNKEIVLTENLPFVPATDYASIKNWYYIQMHSNATYTKYLQNTETYIEWADATVNANEIDSYTWAFVGNVFDGFKLVNYATGETKGINSNGSGNPAMGDIASATLWQIKASRVNPDAEHFCFQYPGSNNYMNAQGGKVAFWDDNDNGSTMWVTERDLSGATELQAVIDQVETFVAAGVAGGTTVGYLTSESVANVATALAAAKEAVASKEGCIAAQANLQAAVAAVETIQPEEGKFYTISSAMPNSDGRSGQKMYVNNEGGMQFNNGNAIANVFQFVSDGDGKFFLKSVDRGTYMNSAKSHNGGQETAVAAETENAKAIAIANMGRANVVSLIPNGGAMMHAQAAGSSVVAWNNTDNAGASAWVIEEVNIENFAHTVTVGEAGWATLYLGYNATIPAGVTAYAVTDTEGWATLAEVSGTIPANEAVLIKAGAGNYDFKFAETAAPVATNLLEGSVFDTNVADDAYVLGLVDSEVGFYTATKNQQEGAAFKNNAFKAYLPKPANAQGALRFNFGGNTTAIESVLNNGVDANAPIYDLSGRRVNNAVKGGIYIQNGKKFIVK